jgi:hypothetical protein
MNVRSLRTTQVLVVLGLVGAAARAQAAPQGDPPPDDGFAVEDESPPEGEDEGEVIMPSTEPTEPPAGPPTEPPAEDEGEVIMPSTAPPAEDGKTEPPPTDEGEWTFEVEDVSEDPSAIEDEVKAATVEATKGPAGTVKGRLRDSVTGDPLIGATIEVVSGKYKTKTDANGEFSLRLPPGVYELRLRGDASQPLRVSQVEVRQDGTVELDRELRPLAGAGQVVKVEAEMNRESEGARLLQRKESVSARDLLSRDEIAKSGGGSTSSVARRIVGSTVVGGRYLFIRGLGHRYGNTLFDGARVPSPEPELRTVPLDIFPSGALSAINVQKTFTPDVPADFAGGSTQLESRDVPDEFLFEVSAEAGANTATTGRQMVTNGGFLGADAFGFGNLPRALPSALPTDAPVLRSEVDENFQRRFTDADIERFGESLNTDTRIRRGSRAPINYGFGATVGHGFEYGNDGKFGFVASVGYRSRHQTLREQNRLFALDADDRLTAVTNYDYGFKSTYNVAWSGIGLVKWKLNKHHRLELLGLYSRDADDETRELRGIVQPVSPTVPVINTRQRYVMRSVLMTRLGGKHELPRAKGLTFDWFGSYAQARRDDPSMRDMLFNTEAGAPVLDTTNNGGKQLFLGLVDDTESGALPLPMGTGNVLGPDTIGGGDPNGTVPFFLAETTRNNDNYEAEQELYATYAMIDLPLVRWLKLAGGARFEASFIDMNAFDLFNPGAEVPDASASLRGYDVLPSASLIFSPTEKMNVRLVGTQTLARPEFRELAPFQFTDFVGGIAVQGEPTLQTTKIWNADLRWEWFPSASEVIAASVFYKRFDRPIERYRQAITLVSFKNAELAQNVGVELEVRKNLEFIGDAFDGFSLGANFAYVYSRVDLGEACNQLIDEGCTVTDNSTSRERALQGQSPYVVNAYLDYTNEDSGTAARLLYNAFGRRIEDVGINGLPDTYEEAIHDFDLVFSQEIHRGLGLTFEIDNILNYPRTFTQGSRRNVAYLAWPGSTFMLGLTYKI